MSVSHPLTSHPLTSHPLVSRSVAVARMHLVDRLTLVVMPAAVVAASIAINVVIWTVVPSDGRSTGGAVSAHVFVLVAAAFAVARGLPFALGMGASRRAFALGTALTGLVLGVGFGTAYLVLAGLERLTDGWGLHGHFFSFAWYDRSAWPAVWLMLVLSILAAFAVGAFGAGLYARWSTPGLVVAGPLVVLLAGGGAVLLSWQGWWSDLGHWLARQTPLAASGWLALLILVLAAATWGVLRRVRV